MKISLCMIVRNNDKTLGACLESVVGSVDEVIIVDTGSIDRTIEIAELFTKNIYNIKWESDFSRARNESIRHATGDAIFWIDSDDTVPPETCKALDAIRRETDTNCAYIMRVRNIHPVAWAMEWPNEFDQIKIFPNKPNIKFEGMLHEQAINSVLADKTIEIRKIDCFIDHHGYSNEKELENKIHRNLLVGINEARTKKVLPPVDFCFQFRIGKYFFIYIPNELCMYSNAFSFELCRNVMKRALSVQVFSNRTLPFRFGIEEQAHLIDKAASMISGYEAGLNSELYRLNDAIEQYSKKKECAI